MSITVIKSLHHTTLPKKHELCKQHNSTLRNCKQITKTQYFIEADKFTSD